MIDARKSVIRPWRFAGSPPGGERGELLDDQFGITSWLMAQL